MLRAFNSDLRYWHILLLGFLGSLILSGITISSDDIINSDGMIYLNSARLYMEGKWSDAYAAWQWPLYPLLIAAIGSIFSITLETSAYTLNAIFWTVVTTAFIMLVKEMGANKRQLVAALIVILILPKINDYREYIIRDAGYIAFYLLSLLFIIRQSKTGAWVDSLLWGASILIAGLFRTEGFIFAIILPLYVFLYRELPLREKLLRIIHLNSLIILLVIGLAIAFIVSPELRHLHQQYMNFEALELVKKINFIFDYVDVVSAVREKIEVYVLPKGADQYAWIIYISSVLIIFLFEVLKSAGVILGLIIAYAVYKKTFNFSASVMCIWLAAIIGQLFILLVFVAGQMFLSGRYLLTFVILATLLAPFGLLHVYDLWKSETIRTSFAKYAFPVLSICLLYNAIDSVTSFGHSKLYIKEAGLWLKMNSPRDIKLLSTEMGPTYYSGHENYSVNDGDKVGLREYTWDEAREILSSGKWKEYDYMVFRIKKNAPRLPDQIFSYTGLKPFKKFSNDRGDAVIIYKLDKKAKTAKIIVNPRLSLAVNDFRNASSE